jgi:hypothetical protein
MKKTIKALNVTMGLSTNAAIFMDQTSHEGQVTLKEDFIPGKPVVQ